MAERTGRSSAATTRRTVEVQLRSVNSHLEPGPGSCSPGGSALCSKEVPASGFSSQCVFPAP